MAESTDHTLVVTPRTVYDVACSCGYSWDSVEDQDAAMTLAESHIEYCREVLGAKVNATEQLHRLAHLPAAGR